MKLTSRFDALVPHAALACALVALAGPAAAGPVEVLFVDADNFADAGTRRVDEEDNLKKLSDHLQALGRQYLPADRSLKLEVLDVDLAGEPLPTTRGDLRISRGTADIPRIRLRYSLQGDGKTLMQGEETISDLNYQRNIRTPKSELPLAPEKLMLEQWFRARFGTAVAHGS
jgi:hypothetical protein